MKIAEWIIRTFANREPDFLIGDPEAPYLRRWWVIPRNKIFNIYLHQILKSDDDRAQHDHPWVNVSILLKGSYIEHTPKGSFTRTAPSLVFRKPTSLHRLELLPHSSINLNEKPTWSLFLTGPVVRVWGFACPNGWVPWREFTSPAAKGQIGRGCGEV